MELKIINNIGEEVFYVNTKILESKSSEKLKEFESYMNKELKSVKFIMEDNKTVTDFNKALSDGDGEGIVKIQILNLK